MATALPGLWTGSSWRWSRETRLAATSRLILPPPRALVVGMLARGRMTSMSRSEQPASTIWLRVPVTLQRPNHCWRAAPQAPGAWGQWCQRVISRVVQWVCADVAEHRASRYCTRTGRFRNLGASRRPLRPEATWLDLAQGRPAALSDLRAQTVASCARQAETCYCRGAGTSSPSDQSTAGSAMVAKALGLLHAAGLVGARTYVRSANSLLCSQAACFTGRRVRVHSSSISGATARNRASISGVEVSAASSTRWPLGSKK